MSRYLSGILVALFFVTTSAKSQVFLPGSFIDYNYRGNLLNNTRISDSAFKKKWFVTKYGGINTSFTFFKGGNATVVAAPLGLQLNRKLNNNLFAFAGVSVAPAYVNFNSPFVNPNFDKLNANGTFNSKTLGLYSRAELGLQYVNDERTFSISGSIGIERNSYPMPAYMPLNRSTNQAYPVLR